MRANRVYSLRRENGVVHVVEAMELSTGWAKISLCGQVCIAVERKPKGENIITLWEDLSEQVKDRLCGECYNQLPLQLY